MKVNDQIIEYIRSGITTFDYFNYDGKLLKLRPLRSSELDDAKLNGYKFVNPKLAKLLLNIYIGKVDANKLRSDYPPEMAENFDRYYREIDYWLVYHSMKDFCDETFSIKDVRNMRYVHDIAKFILSMTTSDSATIRRILKTEEGERIATFIHIFHQPLSLIKDMTPIQEEFIFQSNPSVNKKKLQVDSMEELENILPHIKDLL